MFWGLGCRVRVLGFRAVWGLGILGLGVVGVQGLGGLGFGLGV